MDNGVTITSGVPAKSPKITFDPNNPRGMFDQALTQAIDNKTKSIEGPMDQIPVNTDKHPDGIAPVEPTPQELDAPYTDPTQFSPSSWEQLGGMLSSDNPIMQAADTRGRQQAAQGGLLNSSLAGQATQAAMVDAAQPFALQDANVAAGLLSDRQEVENQRAMTEVLRTQNAPEWMFNVLNSEMPADQKEFLMDTFYPDGVEGIEYGEGGAPIMGAGGTASDNFNWGDYNSVRGQFDGQYANYLADSNARGQWRTSKDQEYGDFLDSMGGDWAQKNPFTKQYVHKNKAKDMVNMYGSYDNALRAVKMWMGPGFSEKDYNEMIIKGVRP